MLDQFLEVMYKQSQQTSIRNQMAEGLRHLPVDELKKIASGEIKLADGDDDDWLCKFKGTPMYDEALQLETECLELDAQQQQLSLSDNEERRARDRERDAIWDSKDAIRLKKRLLELELRKAELSAAGADVDQEPVEEEMEPPEEEALAPEGEKDAAAAYFVNKMRHEAMAKFAFSSAAISARKPVTDMYSRYARKTDIIKNLNPTNKVKATATNLKNRDADYASLRKGIKDQNMSDATNRALEVVDGPSSKIASMRFAAAAHRMQKEAGLGQVASTAWQGLKGAGNFLGAAGKGVAQAGKEGGWQGAKDALGRVSSLGGQMAGSFVKNNPQAAAMIGGGALGATALGAGAVGAGAGRATA